MQGDLRRARKQASVIFGPGDMRQVQRKGSREGVGAVYVEQPMGGDVNRTSLVMW